MKFVYGYLSLCLVSLVVFSSCRTSPQNSKKTDDKYLYNDFKPDEFYPAGQVEIQIPSAGSAMYGLAYTADGKGPHPTLVLLHGLPGNERNIDIAQALRRAGYNVVYFNYRGAWGSKGVFGFQHAINDAHAMVDYLVDSLNSATLRVDTSRIAFLGHSMGAGISLLAGIEDPRVKSVIGVSVFNPYTLLQGEEGRGTLISLKQYLVTLGMLNTDPDKFLTDMVDNVTKFNIGEKISRSTKPVLVIDEHMNNQEFTQFNNKRKGFTYKIWNTDHAFSNRRIALTVEVKNWLDKTIPAPGPEEED